MSRFYSFSFTVYSSLAGIGETYDYDADNLTYDMRPVLSRGTLVLC